MRCGLQSLRRVRQQRWPSRRQMSGTAHAGGSSSSSSSRSSSKRARVDAEQGRGALHRSLPFLLPAPDDAPCWTPSALLQASLFRLYQCDQLHAFTKRGRGQGAPKAACQWCPYPGATGGLAPLLVAALRAPLACLCALHPLPEGVRNTLPTEGLSRKGHISLMIRPRGPQHALRWACCAKRGCAAAFAPAPGESSPLYPPLRLRCTARPSLRLLASAPTSSIPTSHIAMQLLKSLFAVSSKTNGTGKTLVLLGESQ